MSERHERVGDKPRMRCAGRIVGMRLGQIAEIFERPLLIDADAVAIGVDAAELPDRTGHAALGGVFESQQALVDPPLTHHLIAGSQRVERRRRRRNGTQRRTGRRAMRSRDLRQRCDDRG